MVFSKTMPHLTLQPFSCSFRMIFIILWSLLILAIRLLHPERDADLLQTEHHFSEVLKRVIQSFVTQFSVSFDSSRIRHLIGTCKIHLSVQQVDFCLTRRWVMSRFEMTTVLLTPPFQLAFMQLLRGLCTFSVHSRMYSARLISSRLSALVVQCSSIFTDTRCLTQLRFFLDLLFTSRCHMDCLSVIS